MTNAADYRDKSPDELRDELARLKKEAFNIRFQRAAGSFQNTARIREVRRDTARVLTVLGEKSSERPEGGEES